MIIIIDNNNNYKFIYRLRLWCIEKLSEKSIDLGLVIVIYEINKKWLIYDSFNYINSRIIKNMIFSFIQII